MTKKSINRNTAAQIVREKCVVLLIQWEALCRAQVPAARNQSRIALRDSMPEFIEQLSLTLESSNPKALSLENAKVAEEHGEDRAGQDSYTLEQVIFEYHILRKELIRILEIEGSLRPEARAGIDDFVELGIRKAAVKFAEIEAKSQALQTAELKASRIEAERANLAKTAFLANVSHEIRTPLGAIMGFVSLLRDPDANPEESANFLSVIDRNTHQLLRIVDDILDLSKVESGKVSLEFTEFSLIQFLSEFSSFAGLKAREKRLRKRAKQRALEIDDDDLPF